MLTNKTRAVSLSPRLNAAFALLIVAPTLITALLLGMRMYSSIEEGAIEASAATVEQVRKAMDTAVAHQNRELRVAATRLDFLKAVRAYIRADGRAQDGMMQQRATFTNAMMALSMSLDKRIATEIVSDSGMMARLDYRITHENPAESEIFREAMASPDFLNWFSTRPFEYQGFVDAYKSNRQNASAIVVSVKLRDYINGDVLALMNVALDETLLSDLYTGTPLVEGSSLFILDEAGRMISSADTSLILSSADPAISQGMRAANAPGGHFSVGSFARHELVTFSTSRLTGWHVVSVNRYRDMMAGLYDFVPAVLLIIVLCVLLSLLLAMLVARSVTMPVGHIMRAMDQVKRENRFSVRIEDGGRDELHVLAERFNDMVSHTGALIEDINRAQAHLREAEFKALESQINPHFLYNTLDTISWMAFSRGAGDIAQITGSMSRLYRLTLNRGLEKCKVAQELEHVKHYLAIYFASHPGEIDVRYNVDEPVLGYATLKLLLQPLVENALFHGIEPAGGAGSIEINIYLLDESLVMDVVDDGVGTADAPPQSKGYGIHNIDTRVKLYFGAPYGLELIKRPERGTIARITQSAQLWKEEQPDDR